MPDSVYHDAESQSLFVGSGQIAPVPVSTWEYSVGGMQVVKKWVSYRLQHPRRRATGSPLDEINAATWSQQFTDELLDLLHVVGRLVKLHCPAGATPPRHR